MASRPDPKGPHRGKMEPSERGTRGSAPWVVPRVGARERTGVGEEGHLCLSRSLLVYGSIFLCDLVGTKSLGMNF